MLINNTTNMKTSEYPYGKVTKSLKKAAAYLNKNYRKIIKNLLDSSENLTYDDIAHSFDYPDYLDMPKSISFRLNTDEVDWLQSEWFELVEKYKTKYGQNH